jgi:hypothetical protein
MNQVARSALLVIVLGGGSILTVAWAQTPEAKEAKKEPAPAAASDKLDAQPGPGDAAFEPPAEIAPRFHHFDDGGGMGSGGSWSGSWGEHGRHGIVRRAFPHPRSREEMQEFEAFHRAVEKLKSAKSDADKTNATNELSKLLDKSFQRDLERREHEIAQVEARVKKLRDQIEKRKKAKDDILNLRLKTIVNEADGLGFPGGFEADSDLFSSRPKAFRVPGPQHEFDFSPLQTPAPLAPPAGDASQEMP